MSFTKEKRNRIINYIMEKIDNDASDFCDHVCDAFEISVTTVRRYIKWLLEDGKIKADAEKKSGYSLQIKTWDFEYENTNLGEDIIFMEDIRPIVSRFPQNVQRIWYYAFTEMMNNAIDHSESNEIFCRVNQNELYTEVVVMDKGIGIFNRIKMFLGSPSLQSAAFELYKGKLTTAPEAHSGEGIFFTSRIMDHFYIYSNGFVFNHNNLEDEQYKPLGEDGTAVVLRLSNYSKKETKEVFDVFTSESGSFTKTEIPIKSICEFGYPVSRSQAKRLCNRFEKFSEVILDFAEVDEIGQAFAHEIFVVFQNRHPELKIIDKNANSEVKKMINHALSTNS